jgi:hypothetical protein
VSATLADANPTVLALATAIGLLAALVQFRGLVRCSSSWITTSRLAMPNTACFHGPWGHSPRLEGCMAGLGQSAVLADC